MKDLDAQRTTSRLEHQLGTLEYRIANSTPLTVQRDQKLQELKDHLMLNATWEARLNLIKQPSEIISKHKNYNDTLALIAALLNETDCEWKTQWDINNTTVNFHFKHLLERNIDRPVASMYVEWLPDNN